MIRSSLRVLAITSWIALGTPSFVMAQEGGAQEPGTPPAPKILLQTFPQRDRVIRVLDETTYEDLLNDVRMTQGEEVLLPLEDGANPFAIGRSIEIHRQFADRIQQVDTPADGPWRINGLSRRYAKLEYVLRSREKHTARGSREKRESADLVGKGIRVNRTGDKVTASMDRPPQQPGTPPPPEPPQEDLSLLRIESHLESVLPGREIAQGESWVLSDEAVRSLLGGTDGYPLVRAENVLKNDEAVPRSNDPVAAFLARGKVTAKATLESFDQDAATISIAIQVALEGVDPYVVAKANDDAKPEGSDGDAATDETKPVGDTWSWTGTLEASGKVTYAIRQRYVTHAHLEGKLDVTIQGKGPEGPAQIELSAKNQGTLERTIRIFQDATS